LVDLLLCAPVARAADTPEEAHSKPFVASMGMYVIKRKVLQELLSTRFPRVRPNCPRYVLWCVLLATAVSIYGVKP
jgi:hypothetical protein